jgi:hypothetical protein
MKVKYKAGYERKGAMDVEMAVRDLLEGGHSYHEGALESLQTDITNIKEVLGRFMALHIKSVGELNAVAGWERFEEAD